MKALKDCKTFFLDTGVIIDRMKIDLSKSPADVQKRVSIINSFFETLNNPRVYGKIKKVYQVSAITLSEIFHLDNHQSKTVQAVISAFNNAGDCEVFSFDETTAAYHNTEFYGTLFNKHIAQLKKDVDYPNSIYTNIEDRIRKDMLIVATAKMFKSDVVLTTDAGFKTLCDILNVPCHCFTHDDNQFQASEDGKIFYDFA